MTQRTALTASQVAFISSLRVGRLATADESGNPTAVPVCYAFDGIYFYIVLDEKPKRVQKTQLRRVRNIEVRPEVSLLIDQYDDDWSQLGFVLIHGKAILIDAKHEQHENALLLLRERYIQYRDMALEDAPMIRITPTQVTAWGPALRI